MENHTSNRTEKKRDLAVGHTLFKYMKRYSNNILQYIADTGETDTYEQVLTRSIRTALKLKERGITKGDVISSCTYNHKNSCIPLLASFFLGAIPANFDPSLPHIDTVYLLKLVRPKVIFVSTDSLDFMEKCLNESQVETELVVFGHSRKYSLFSEYLMPNLEEENFKPVHIDDSNETAIILFSSGTTGFPKGICLSHYSVLRHLNDEDSFEYKEVNARSASVWLFYTTFYWISATTFFIARITEGDAVVICSKFEAFNAWRYIEKYKVVVMFLVPYLASQFVHDPPKDTDTSSLKMLLIGGSPVTEALMEDLRNALPHTKVLQGYGQTEAGSGIAFFFPQDVEMQIRKPLSCGKILSVVQWKVVDLVTEEKLKTNQRGELRVKSDFLMNGYYKMDSSSAFNSEGYLKTGDIVYYDEEECFYVVDRIKEMFKYKMFHILPAILEEVLMSHPAVKDAVVIGVPHGIDGEHPMGLVVLRDEYEDVTPKDIELFVEERVSEMQKLRAGVKIIKEILRTVTSKVRRNEMKRMVLSGEI